MKNLLSYLFGKIPKDLSIVDSYWVRGFFILPLGAFGIMHFIVPQQFEFMVPHYAGFPNFWVHVSGVALTLAAVCIFTKFYAKIANLFLILFVLTFILTVDIPNSLFGPPEMSFYFTISWLKDTSLLGGSLFYYYISRMRKKEHEQTL